MPVGVPHEDGVRRAMTHAGRALEGEKSRHTSAMVSEKLLARKVHKQVIDHDQECEQGQNQRIVREDACAQVPPCRVQSLDSQEKSRIVTEDK